MDGVFGKQSLKGDLVGHAMVAGSRAHLEKSQAVVQVGHLGTQRTYGIITLTVEYT
jgi:hypothetical protein